MAYRFVGHHCYTFVFRGILLDSQQMNGIGFGIVVGVGDLGY